jgi:hypothetical protein
MEGPNRGATLRLTHRTVPPRRLTKSDLPNPEQSEDILAHHDRVTASVERCAVQNVDLRHRPPSVSSSDGDATNATGE